MLTHFTKSHVLTRAENFFPLKNILLSSNLNSVWSKCSGKLLTHVASSYCPFGSNKWISFFSSFCTFLICKIKLQITRMVNMIKSLYMCAYMWKWKVVPFIECDVALAMSHDCFEALYYFTLELWSLIFSMWMSTLCYFPRRQSVHTWMVSSKLPGLWAKASDLCIDSGLLCQSWAGTPSADLTSCNADAKPFYLLYSQLEYASFLSWSIWAARIEYRPGGL